MNHTSNEQNDAPHLVYDVVCVDQNGVEKWRETVRNLVTTAGKNDLVDKYFKGTAYTAAWFLGLKGTGTITSTDTLASPGAWVEVTPYTGNRPGVTWGSTSAGSNTGSTISITITATATVAGAFLAQAATGTSAILYSVVDFTVARGVSSGDTLAVTPVVTIS